MSYIPPVFGSGQIYGNFIVRGTNFYIGDIAISMPFHVRIAFYSQTGTFVGDINTLAEDAGFLQFDITDEKIGGLKRLNFTVSKVFNFSIFNLMEIRFFISGIHWYTAELRYNPNQDTREIEQEYECVGFIDYLKKIKVNVLYQNKTVPEIITDLITNYLVDDTPLLYDPSKIILPDVNVTKLELNDKTIYKGFEKILEILNYDYQNHQYEFGVDKNKFIYFNEINREVNFGFFEGYHFQNPDIKTNTDDIINKLDIYRSQEDSQQVELVQTIEDTESQGLYGLHYDEKGFTIPDYIDNTTAILMAQSKLNLLKEPLVIAKINDLSIEFTPYQKGFYKISSKFDTYLKQITDCESFDNWNLNRLFTTGYSLETVDTFSGRKSIKIETGEGSFGEFMTFTLDESIMYPTMLRIYLKQNIRGIKLFITAIDDEGNEVSEGEVVPNKLLLETGGFLLLEDGGRFNLENVLSGIGINVKIIGDWFPYKLDISSISNIKQIKITFITDDNVEILIDRIEAFTKSWFTRTLVLDSIKYSGNRTSVLANVTLGNSAKSIVTEIKKLEKDTDNLSGIFEKS